MRLDDEWRALQRALRFYIENGGTMTRLAKQAGVTRQTLYAWMEADQPPESIAKGAAVMEILGNADA